VRKVFRPVGIIFKGSGFHVNDYRKPEKKEAAGSASTKDKGSD
jgi:predicted nucleic acid-binding Zn ribbon protein